MSRKGLLLDILEKLEEAQYMCETSESTPDDDDKIYQGLVDLINVCEDTLNPLLLKKSG